jgi:hypothetical protein
MTQKLKFSLSALGIIALLAIGIFAYQIGQEDAEIVNQPKINKINTTDKITATPVIGDAEIDMSINATLDEVSNETDLDAELADVELIVSDEDSLNQINNLINDDEL